MRLRRADCSGPGISRRKAGRGFSYTAADGERVQDPEVLARIRALAIPPAWRDVWICPHSNGHLQATGTDAAGRKQYRYHEVWRTRQDALKFEEMTQFARALPALRARVADDLSRSDALTLERVQACAVRLLELGFFRVGTEAYSDSFGLATMRKEHVRVDADGTMVFDYVAKAGVQQIRAIIDPLTAGVVTRLKRRRGGGEELLAWRPSQRGAWRDLRSDDINDYIKAASRGDYSAKDFRTWNATVLAALALSVSAGVRDTKTARKRAVNRAVQEVAFYLGNTPTVARSSYIDPRVFDAYDAGLTIRPALLELEAEPGGPAIHHPRVERAVLDLLEEKVSSRDLVAQAA